MSLPAILFCALVLDALLGEPRWLWSRMPHPAVLMGRAIGALDARWNAPPAERIKGVIAVALLVTVSGVVGLALAQLGWIVEVVLAAILLAQRSLVSHVAQVADGLRHSVEAGRAAVRMIVGRDVTEASGPEISRAAIESLAENFSDGVIAPAFWFLVAGLPGILIYKVVNTADSMIGYLTPRHAAFGWAAARLDDVLNWVPARLTGVLIAAVGGCLRDWAYISADAKRHRSPNAGWPEAAAARVLTIALAGPRRYHGRTEDLAWVNAAGRRATTPNDIDAAVRLVWKAWGAFLGVVLCLGVLMWVF